jgi:hypothetical protein
MPPKVLRGALKNKGEKVYTSGGQGTSAIPLTPGTLYISSAVGIGKRGVDLQACYQVPEDINGAPWGFTQRFISMLNSGVCDIVMLYHRQAKCSNVLKQATS